MTEAQEFEGKWVLRGTKRGEEAVLVTDRYGLRLAGGFYDGDGNLHLLSSSPYLSGEELAHLRELIEGVWMCQECRHWSKGEGYCPWCGKEQK